MTKKTWKEETEAKTLTKCLPYCLFPWADTDAFARGRPPTQSNTHHMIYSKTQRGRRERKMDGCLSLFHRFWQNPTVDRWVGNVYFLLWSFTYSIFYRCCFRLNVTAMIQVWKKGILMVFICNHSRIRPGWYCNILSEKEPHACHLVQKNNTDCVFSFSWLNICTCSGLFILLLVHLRQRCYSSITNEGIII